LAQVLMGFEREPQHATMAKLFLALGLCLQVSGVELSQDNWEAETSGKTVFVKFLAPW